MNYNFIKFWTFDKFEDSCDQYLSFLFLSISWLSKVITSHFTMAASTALNEPSLMLVAMPKQGAPEASCKFKNSQPISPSMNYFQHWNQKRLNGNRDSIHIPVEHGGKTYQLAKNPPFMLISVFVPLVNEGWKLTSY